MTRYTREELLDLATALAAGTATPVEERALEDAMQHDAELREQVTLHRRTLTALADAQAVAPTSQLRERLLAGARADAATLQHSPAFARSVVLPPRAKRPVVPWLLAACAAIALGLGAEVMRLRDAMAGNLEFTKSLRSELQQRDAALNRLLLAESKLRLALLVSRGTSPSAGAGMGTGNGQPGVQVFWNQAEGTAVVHAFNVYAAPAGRRYQLWVLRGGVPESITVFNGDRSGHALISNVDLPRGLTGAESMSVTLEPVAGSVAPSTEPLMTTVSHGM
jgi:anti-sigma-K factor RskA